VLYSQSPQSYCNASLIIAYLTSGKHREVQHGRSLDDIWSHDINGVKDGVHIDDMLHSEPVFETTRVKNFSYSSINLANELESAPRDFSKPNRDRASHNLISIKLIQTQKILMFLTHDLIG
jgi:hypothetical protein